MPINPKSWAEGFAAELTVSGEPVPVDRLVARHADAFAELRKLGMTWRGIASLLARAGARRTGGGLISSDHLRVSFARLARAQAASDDRPERSATTSPAQIMADAPPLVTAFSPEPRRDELTRREQPLNDKDVSSSEIETALSHLSKVTSKGTSK